MAEQTSQSRKTKPKDYQNTIARWTVVLSVSTILLFVATSISAYFLYTTDRTLQETLAATARAAKATEDSVKLSSKATNIAAESLQLASNTTRRQLRAYLGVTDVKFECTNCTDKKRWTPPRSGVPEVVMNLKVKNFGVTPAYEVHTCSGLYLADPGHFPPEDFAYDCGEFCNTCPRSTLAPGEETAISIGVDPGSVMLAASNLKRMFNFGTVSFRDTFGQERDLPFCWFYQGDQNDNGVGCPKHNSANDD